MKYYRLQKIRQVLSPYSKELTYKQKEMRERGKWGTGTNVLSGQYLSAFRPDPERQRPLRYEGERLLGKHVGGGSSTCVRAARRKKVIWKNMRFGDGRSHRQERDRKWGKRDKERAGKTMEDSGLHAGVLWLNHRRDVKSGVTWSGQTIR